MFESSSPSKGSDHLKYRRLKLEPGKSARGWKAGSAVGVVCHYFGRTKPCLAAISKGALKCPCEIQRIKEGWVGYLPYFSEHGHKMVALFGRETWESVERMPMGSPLKIVKGNYAAAPVHVIVDNWTTAPCPWLKALKCELEIRPWLINLWGIEELKSYFASDPLVPKRIKVEEGINEVLFKNEPAIPELGNLKAVFDGQLKLEPENRVKGHLGLNGKTKKTKKT